MSRKASSSVLKGQLTSIAVELKKVTDAATKLIGEVETPSSVEEIPPLVEKCKKLAKLAAEQREGYATVFYDFADSLETRYVREGKTEEDIDNLVSTNCKIFSEPMSLADRLKSELSALAESLERTRIRLVQDDFQKQQDADADRRRREAEELERERNDVDLKEKNSKIEADLRAKNSLIDFEVKERQKRLELEEERHQSLLALEEAERKAKITNDQRALDLQEAQMAEKNKLEQARLQLEEAQLVEKSKLEFGKLQLVRDSGVTPEAIAALSPSSAQGATRGPSRFSVNRPKIQLKEFSGDPLLYTEFMQGFMNTTGLDDGVSDVLKHSHLRTLLRGEAAEYVRAYDITAENYPIVLKKLERRFCKPELVVKTLMARIYSMDKRNWTAKTSDVHEFFDTFNSCLCRLEALGHNMDDSFPIYHFLCQITPYSVSRDLNNLLKIRGISEDKMNLKLFREVFEEFLLDRDRLDYQTGSKKKTEPPTEDKSSGGAGGKSHPTLSSGTTLTTGSSEVPKGRQGPKPRFPCMYCSGKDHFADQCLKFPSLQSRKEKLKSKGRCTTCGQKEHESSCSKRSCFHCKKEVAHIRSLCPVKFPQPPGTTGSYSTTTVGLSTVTGKTPGVKKAELEWPTVVHLQTATTELRKSQSGKAKVQCRILLDQCSDKCYIATEIAQKLRLKSLREQRLAVYKLGSVEPDIMDTDKVQFEMRLIDGSYMTIIAHTTSPVTGHIQRYPIDPEILLSLGGVTLSDSMPAAQECSHVDVLIGGDVYHKIMSGSKRCLDGKVLFLESSKLGGVLCGAVEGESVPDTPGRCLLTVSHSMSHHRQESAIEQKNESLRTQLFPQPDKYPDIPLSLEEFWKLESIGIDGSPEVSEDDRALEFFEKTVHYDSEKKRYFVKWPQKDDLSELPDNYWLSLGRLKSQLKGLSSDPNGQELLEKYHEVIVDQIRKIIVEEVTPETPTGDVIHYIPHHAVVKENENATTKVRIVYDGGARKGKCGKSLNDLLLRGAVLLLDLTGILLRFRLNPVAVISDIEKAFLQVGLQIPDRDVCRFLWLRDPKKGVTDENLVTYRFTMVPFGVKPSPHLLAVTVAYHLKKDGSPTAMQILNNIYVDNVLTGVSSSEEGLKFYSQAKAMFKEASMNLREWTSNDQSLMSQIPEVDRAKGQYVKVLGLNWDVTKDCLGVAGAKKLLATTVGTKRELLHAVASVYDPLGFLCPVMIRPKIVLQDLWRTGQGWDDPLPEEVIQKWKDLSEDLHLISTIEIPRFVGAGLDDSQLTYQLMCFTGSSKLAFSALTYLKVTDSEKKSNVRLIYAKSRLAPVQEVTIPRLELTGALIGARMMDFIQRETRLTFGGLFMWTDSTCVLDWMNSRKPLPVFVERCLKEIKTLLEKHKFELHYVPTEENPADLATRGCSAVELKENSLWWNGPYWLKMDSGYWPNYKPGVTATTVEGPREVEEPLYEVSLVSTSVREGPTGVKTCQSERIGPFGLKSSNFEKLKHLLRVTAWSSRYLANLKAKSQKKSLTLCEELTSPEIEDAQNLWIRSVQSAHFEQQLRALKSGASRKVRDNLCHQLGLALDENGVIRCHGRLEHSDLTEGAKWPILLPSKDTYTRLVVLDSHLRLHHSGVTQTLALVREKYWILRGRQTVRSVLKGARGCLVCRRHEGGPYTPPRMPPLPASRVSCGEVFSVTGLDYLGPVLVKSHKSQVDTFKVWICIFTCTRVRAIHLEVIEDMTAESFLNALRRFISMRGKPQKIISDNASQFVLTQKMLKRHWNTAYVSHLRHELGIPPAVLSYCSDESIDWDFITPIAPWMGGFYERLVGGVKRCLRKSLSKRLVTFDRLHTLAKEIEAVLNSRPLTVPGNDLEDHIPLTPNHFLMGRVKPGTPTYDSSDVNDPDYEPKRSSAKMLFDTWRFGQRRLDQFWALWKSEYLTSLRESQSPSLRMPRIQAKETPLMGEVVLIFEENQPRGTWRMGRIVDLFFGADDQIRSAMVKLPDGSKLRRAIKHLYPLECQRDDETLEDVQPEDREELIKSGEETEDVQDEDESEIMRKRPVRRAKIKAQQKIEQLAHDDEEADL